MIKIFLLMLCFLSSCTSTTYQSTNLVKVFAGSKLKDNVKKSLTGVNQFYMWGLYPNSHLVNIDQKAIRKGFVEYSVAGIEEFQTLKQFIYSLFTFGMYIPLSYKVTGRGTKSGS